jgi:hypothetical protein
MKDDQPKPVAPRRWRNEDVRGARAEPGSGRRRGLFGLLVALMALVGAFVAWLLLWNPPSPPAFLSFSVTQYSDVHWPVNALAEQDSRHLLAPFQAAQNPRESLLRKARRGEMFTSQVRLRLVEELKKLSDHPDRDQPVIVHLACLARTDAQGQVSLLPADARPEDPASWVALADVLKWVEACPARNKLLLLDVTRPLADPRLGILANDVADRVQDLLAAKKPPYFVLTACSRGQVALVWDEMGQSVFGHYLEEGLQGAADRYGAGAQEGVVHVSGLAEFVTRRVARWAARLEMVQTPFLWSGGARDFVVRAAGGKHAQRDYSDRDYPIELRTGWDTWRAWHNSSAARTAPLTFRELAATLLRAEQRWRGGRDDAGPGPDLASLEQRRANQAPALLPRMPPSLTLIAAQEGRKADPADVKRLRDFLEKIGTGADAAKKEVEVRGEVRKVREKEWKDKKALDIALAVWEVASAEDTPDPYRRAVYLNKWYQQDLYAGATPYVETLFLQRLSQLKETLAPQLTGVIRKAFRCVREGEALLGNARALPWTRQLLGRAEEKREQGENSLFATTWAERQNAEAQFDQALRDFEAVRQAAALVMEAWATRDRALALLPAYPAYLMKRLDYNLGQEAESAWTSAITLTDSLDRELAGRTEAPPSDADLRERLDRVRGLSAQLARSLDELSAPLKGDYVRSLSEATPRNVFELDALLELPWAQARERPTLTPEELKTLARLDRGAVWKQRRQLAKELFDATRHQDAAEDAGSGRTKPPDGFDEKELCQREHVRAVRRARLAVGMLRLGGYKGVDALADELTAAEQDPTADLHALGAKFFEVWSREAPRQLAELKRDTPQGLAAADRLSRILFPLNPEWPWRVADSPAALRRKQETTAYWKWLGEYYQQKSKHGEGRARDFYRNAAEEYLK